MRMLKRTAEGRLAKRRLGRCGLLYGLVVVPIAGCGAEQTSGSREPASVAQRSAALEISEAPIGTDAAVPLQYSTGSYLSLAHDGTNNLVVFYDGGRIRGMRYDGAGNPLDLEAWIPLGRNDDGAGAQAYTDLAFGGGVYLAVFSDGSADLPGMFAQVVAPDGSLASAPVRLTDAGSYAAVVFNGTDFTVATYTGDIELTRVALDGSVVAGSQTSVTTSGIANRPAMAMAGDVGLVVFEQDAGNGRSVYAARFDAAGNVLDPEGVLISDATTSSVNVSVAAGASEFLAVWSANSPRAVMGSVVGFDGSVALREFDISRSPVSVGGSAVAYDGSQYLVAWEDTAPAGTAIYGTRVNGAGTHFDAQDFTLTESSRAYQSWELDLTWTGERYSLAYANNGIEGRFFDADLVALDPGTIELSVLPNAQISPVSAWNGQAYVLGWSDERDSTSHQLRSLRIDDAGNILDPEGIGISPAGTMSFGGLASNGQITLYSYHAYGDTDALFTRTLSTGGVLSDPVPWIGGVDGGQIVSNGETFLGLYSDGDNGNGNPNEIWVQAFDATGAATGVSSSVVTISRPRYGISPLGNEYLLSYSGQEIAGAAITGAVLRLSGSGEVLAEYEPVVEGILSASHGGSGEQMLYSWQDQTTQALWGRLLHKDDGWGEPFVLTDQITEGTPAIAWDGAKFVVAWAEDRIAMWTRNVMADGSMSEPEQLFQGDYGYPRLTQGEGEQLLFSYVRWLEFSRSRRIESRIVGPLGAGVDVPPIDDPAVDDPTVDDPAVDDPSVDDPAVDDPAVDDPAVDDPAVDDPAVDDPMQDPDGGDEPETGASTDADSTGSDGGTDGEATAGTSTAEAGTSGGSGSNSGRACSVSAAAPSSGWGLVGFLLLGMLLRRRRQSPHSTLWLRGSVTDLKQ